MESICLNAAGRIGGLISHHRSSLSCGNVSKDKRRNFPQTRNGKLAAQLVKGPEIIRVCDLVLRQPTHQGSFLKRMEWVKMGTKKGSQ